MITSCYMFYRLTIVVYHSFEIIYIYINYTCFTAKSNTFLKRLLQNFIFKPLHPYFSPHQILVAEDSWQKLVSEITSDGIFHILILLYFNYTLTSRVKWVQSRSHAHFYI